MKVEFENIYYMYMIFWY